MAVSGIGAGASVLIQGTQQNNQQSAQAPINAAVDAAQKESIGEQVIASIIDGEATDQNKVAGNDQQRGTRVDITV